MGHFSEDMSSDEAMAVYLRLAAGKTKEERADLYSEYCAALRAISPREAQQYDGWLK